MQNAGTYPVYVAMSRCFSDTKYDSGTGGRAFLTNLAKTVAERADNSLFMKRTESYVVPCIWAMCFRTARPRPANVCMNGTAMRLGPADP